MNEPNYDSRLEPKMRRRTQEEIDEILVAAYRTYIAELPSADVYDRMSNDEDFQDSIDWDEINYEVT